MGFRRFVKVQWRGRHGSFWSVLRSHFGRDQEHNRPIQFIKGQKISLLEHIGHDMAQFQSFRPSHQQENKLWVCPLVGWSTNKPSNWVHLGPYFRWVGKTLPKFVQKRVPVENIWKPHQTFCYIFEPWKIQQQTNTSCDQVPLTHHKQGLLEQGVLKEYCEVTRSLWKTNYHFRYNHSDQSQEHGNTHVSLHWN